jgi:threonyl-tRNA synthetase
MKIEEEIGALFDFMQHIYGLFGFEFRMELSTRPENHLGAIETWNEAEAVSIFPSFPLSLTYYFLIATQTSPR